MTISPQYLPPIPPLPNNSTALQVHSWAVNIPPYLYSAMPGKNSSYISSLIPQNPSVPFPAWWINGNNAQAFLAAVRSNNFQRVGSTWETEFLENLQHYRTPTALRVYRGMRWRDSNHADYLTHLALQVGQPYIPGNYTPTSCSAFEAHRFCSNANDFGLYELAYHAILVVIDLPHNHPVIPIYHTSEQELVLDKTLHFQVKDLHDDHHGPGKHLRVLILEPAGNPQPV